jgi:hypothetical protein
MYKRPKCYENSPKRYEKCPKPCENSPKHLKKCPKPCGKCPKSFKFSKTIRIMSKATKKTFNNPK